MYHHAGAGSGKDEFAVWVLFCYCPGQSFHGNIADNRNMKLWNIESILHLQGPAMVASPYGGVNIEEIAKASPSYIYKDGVDITSGKEVQVEA